MDPFKGDGQRVLKIPFDTKKIVGFEINLDQLAPGKGKQLRLRPRDDGVEVKNVHDRNPESGNASSEISGVGNVPKVGISGLSVNGVAHGPSNSKKPDNQIGILQSQSGSSEESRNYQVFNPNPNHSATQHLTKEKVTVLNDFYGDLEFIRQKPTFPGKLDQQSSLHPTNPFSREENNYHSNNKSDPEKAIEFSGWNSKQVNPDSDQIPALQRQIEQTANAIKTSALRKKNKSDAHTAKAVHFFEWTSPDPNNEKTSKFSADSSDPSDKPVVHVKSKVALSQGIDLFGWNRRATPPTSNLNQFEPESPSPSPHINLQIFQTNPIVYKPDTNTNKTKTKDLETSNRSSSAARLIEKAKLSNSELAANWDEYTPPSPSSFQDCHVDSGNVDALVSHVLQNRPPTQNSEDESIITNPVFPKKSQTQFFNPGISINFNYNPVFSSDPAWTWNHQNPPGSASSYFYPNSDHDQVVGPDGANSPSYLHSHLNQFNENESISNISLVPMIDSIPSLTRTPAVSSPGDFSPEVKATSSTDVYVDAEADESETIKTNTKSSKKLKSKSTKNTESKNEIMNSKPPLGCRIIEIMNHFNKLEDDAHLSVLENETIGSPASPILAFSQRPQRKKANTNNTGASGSRSTFKSSESISRTTEKLQNRQSYRESIAMANSHIVQRNIIQENIFLAKYPSRKTSVHLTPKSHSTSRSNHFSDFDPPVLVQTQRLPAPEATDSRKTNRPSRQGSSVVHSTTSTARATQNHQPPVPTPPRGRRSPSSQGQGQSHVPQHSQNYFHNRSHARMLKVQANVITNNMTPHIPHRRRNSPTSSSSRGHSHGSHFYAHGHSSHQYHAQSHTRSRLQSRSNSHSRSHSSSITQENDHNRAGWAIRHNAQMRLNQVGFRAPLRVFRGTLTGTAIPVSHHGHNHNHSQGRRHFSRHSQTIETPSTTSQAEPTRIIQTNRHRSRGHRNRSRSPSRPSNPMSSTSHALDAHNTRNHNRNRSRPLVPNSSNSNIEMEPRIPHSHSQRSRQQSITSHQSNRNNNHPKRSQ